MNQENNQLTPPPETAAKHKDVNWTVWLSVLLGFVFPPLFILLLIYAAWLGTRGHRRLAIMLLATLVTAVLGSLVYYRYRPQNGEITIRSSFVTEKTSPATVGALGFLKPDSFNRVTNVNANNVQTVIYTKNKKSQIVGYLAISAAKNNLVDDQKYMTGVNSLMKSGPAAPAYAKFAEPFTSFIKSFNSPDLTFKLDNPKPFTSASIKNNAWLIGFSGDATGAKNVAPMQGDFILIAQKGHFYYFVIETSKTGWNEYTTVRLQVLDSLKVQ